MRKTRAALVIADRAQRDAGGIGEHKEVDLTGPDVVPVHLMCIAKGVDKRVFVARKSSKSVKADCGNWMTKLVGGLAHGDTLGQAREAGRIRTSAGRSLGRVRGSKGSVHGESAGVTAGEPVGMD